MTGSILIVDDEATLAETIRDHFAAEGLDALCVSSGEEALRLAKEHAFDVIVTDLKMPGMSGLDVMRALRANAHGPCVIVMTAYGTLETAVEAFRLGATDFVQKPVSLEELTAGVERALASRLQPVHVSLPLHALRNGARRAGSVRVEVAGDPAAAHATVVWLLHSIDRGRTAFVWGHIEPGTPFSATARLLLFALARVVDLSEPQRALEQIVAQLRSLNMGSTLRAVTVGILELNGVRRLVGASCGSSGLVVFHPAAAAFECVGEAPSDTVREFEVMLELGDCVLLVDARLVTAAGARWQEVLASLGTAMREGESRPAQRMLALLADATIQAPVVVTVRPGEPMTSDGLMHVRVASNAAGLIHARDVTEQFALSTSLNEQAAHDLVSAVQEALLNCIRWAYPGAEGPVYLTMSRDDDCFSARVRDRGLGFDVGDAYRRATEPSRDPLRASGRGLLLMQRLADRLDIVSRPGRGTNVVIEKNAPAPPRIDVEDQTS